jgi:N-acetylglucosaminyldiphosphoundecaprenol N-acetyl-beta-D-mannosaminyltransferase
VDTAGFLDVIEDAVDAGEPLLVLNHNVNSLALMQRDADYAAVYGAADLIFIDGAPVIALGRALGLPLRVEHRLAVLDWIWPFFDRAQRLGWHVVHLGSSDDVLRRAEAEIAARAPALAFTAIPGYFDQRAGSPGNDAVLDRLNDEAPDVLLVGMGMPRQELWIRANRDRLPPCVTITVGGIIGFIGGDRPTPPRWIGPLGMEWLFRLVTEPRRLWRRYLVEPLILVPVIASAMYARLRGRPPQAR